MRNPWTRKHPLLSMWLCVANKVVGSARTSMLEAPEFAGISSKAWRLRFRKRPAVPS